MPGHAGRLPSLLLCLASVLPCSPSYAETETEAADADPKPVLLTLADAVRQALARNDRMAGWRDSTEQANLSLRLAKSQFRPKLVPNILGSFGQSDVSNQTYRLDLSQRFTTGTELRASVGAISSQNQLGNYYNSDTTLQISQPLLRGFGKSARRQLASAEARLADVTRQEAQAERQLVVETARAYYSVVSQKRLADVAAKALERAKKLLEASEAKLEAGKVSQLDALRAQQLAAQAEGQLLDAQGALQDAMEQLRILLDQESDYEFEVVPDVPHEAFSLSEDAAVAQVLQNRPELPGAQEAAAEADRAVSYAKNQLLPQFDLSLALTRRETAETFRSSFGLDRFNFATFFAISVPIDRTPQTIEHHNSLIERDRRRRDLRAIRMRLASEARRAVRHEQRLEKALQAAEATEGFAEKELEVAELRYQRGLSNNLDVVSAEGNLLAAQARRIAKLADLAVAHLALRATLGILDARKDLESPAP